MERPGRGLALWQAVCLCVLAVLVGGLLLLPPLRQADFQPVGDPEALIAPQLIDLNTADAKTLCRLPGVGETRAAAILADRAVNGPYETLQDVCRVEGITPGLVERWEGLVRTGTPG